MPAGASGRGHSGLRNDSNSLWAPQQGARAPSAMPLNKAAPGPKMNGFHGEATTGAVHGPLGRNDGVLYGRMPGGENAAHAAMWSAQGQMNMRHGGLGEGRMHGMLHGMPPLQPQGDGNGLVDRMEGLHLQAGGGDGSMMRAQRAKFGDGDRHEETDDDLFAMFRFKVRLAS